LPFLDDLEGLLGPQNCTICDRNISKSIKIKCTECDNLYLCLDCLRKGTTGETAHNQTHKYFPYDKLDFPIFTEDWKASEELKLIQGIMKCGMGNWTDIQEQYVKEKKPSQVEEHYHSFYYEAKDDDLPKKSDFIISGSKVGKKGEPVWELDKVIAELN
jgi:transcriptional adapter 2-alpha